MTFSPQHIPASTVHTRKGVRPRSFRYGVDYVLIDPKNQRRPLLFSRNGFNLTSVHDRHHGGSRGAGRGVVWAEEVFAEYGLRDVNILLLTQPRFLGYIFNPVSFWLAFRDGELFGAIAEVNNTFGDRHSYVCVGDKAEPISTGDTLRAAKQMHVSPFQRIEGVYSFNFSILDDRLSIKINLDMPNGGLFASLTGPRKPLTNAAILGMLARRPFGPLRTITLIYWQALKLKFRGETYLSRPTPPEKEIS